MTIYEIGKNDKIYVFSKKTDSEILQKMCDKIEEERDGDKPRCIFLSGDFDIIIAHDKLLN